MIEDGPAAVVASGLSVRLRHESDRVRSLREALVRSLERASLATRWIDVLDDVSFRVGRGELFAVLGPNGAGKTTLLRVLAGIVVPCRGEVTVRGRLAPLIDLGAGFDPELTGDENVELFGTILGMPRSWVREQKACIAAFAGLEDVLDVPVRNYSSGMVARLGFAVATAAEPEVLLIDEVLAVGDEEFRTRCFRRIESLRKKGTCVVLVSHDLDLIRDRADHAMLLWHGRVQAAGSPSDVVAYYRSESAG